MQTVGGGTISIRQSEQRESNVSIRSANRLSMKSYNTLKSDINKRDLFIQTMEFWDQVQTLPSFMTILYCFFSELILEGSFETIGMYCYCIGWKLKCLMKLTFGYWDDELLRGMQIKDKAEIYDEDPNDDIEHHDDMIRLKGQAHSLIWQFIPILVILSKLSEAINESPLFIKPEQQEIKVRELCETPEIDEDLGWIERIGLRIYHLIDGRIFSFIFSMIGLIVAVALIFSQDSRIIILFAIFIVPERCAKVAKRTGLVNQKFPHLQKVRKWVGC